MPIVEKCLREIVRANADRQLTLSGKMDGQSLNDFDATVRSLVDENARLRATWETDTEPISKAFLLKLDELKAKAVKWQVRGGAHEGAGGSGVEINLNRLKYILMDLGHAPTTPRNGRKVTVPSKAKSHKRTPKGTTLSSGKSRQQRR